MYHGTHYSVRFLKPHAESKVAVESLSDGNKATDV